MVEDDNNEVLVDDMSTDEWLSHSQELVPVALQKAKQVKGFTGRWKIIISKLEQIPSRLSDLSSHPLFSKNALCKEQLQAVSKTLNEAIEWAELCVKEKYEGKLRMQSDLDALSGKLDLNLRDCGLLIKTAEEGIVKVMINLLDCGILLGSKEYAAECLQNLTASNENLRRSIISEGGIRSLLAYLDGPLPQESAVGALRNMVGSVSTEMLVSLGFLPCLTHVLKSGSSGGQQAAASAICRVCNSIEMKKLVGEAGCIPLLIKMLEVKSNSVREVAAQAISSLITLSMNCREVKRDDKSVPNLVQLLDPSPQNTAKKYAVSCLTSLSPSRKCKKLMISYGAIGYLKKLSEMDVPGAKKMLERLERGKLRSLFSRK
ncbi:hypothetical protein HS088_TW18G00379 [Tripterygium wilfordii]|uniref:DUF7032 domain-containing protein n=1 Tax=Tripterygium wilfordii TaxID=458696 RepID=A0A7J7CCN1_TRIWF|nr:hypothetical protein HS088_TW18G00379 [Tripterygium wilfordii]